MKLVFSLIFILGLVPMMAAQVTDTLVLIWNDEFNGSELDNSKWGNCPEWFRQGKSYWEADNAWVDGNGNLKLKVSESNGQVYAGAVRTHNKYNQKYGYFEVRCKVPQIKGGWAAFWMMPYGNKVGSQGNDGTELDIFESINGWNGKIQHALHWDGYGAEHQKASISMTNWGLYDGDFHKFGMMWTPEEYIFYIDDVETWRSSAGGVSDVEQYMKLTMEVSNQTWPGNWNQQTTKPITWTIDYVRTYVYGIKKPDVSFAVPNNNSTVFIGSTQKLKALVEGSFDYLTTVEFYAHKDGGSEELIKLRNIGANSDSLFYAPWTPTDTGSYTITVRGKKDGLTLTDTQIRVTVGDFSTATEPINQYENIFFPNPATDVIIFSKKFELVEIYNNVGQQIKGVKDGFKVEISEFKPGNYIVVINKEVSVNLLIK
jgi:beta-glucanase (GH16 family)